MARWQGTTAQRGYGTPHRKLRARWKPVVDAGHGICHAAICLMPTRHITPGTPWHLGHTPDRTAWTGPEHERCNESDGARRGNRNRPSPRRRRTLPQTAWTTSRRW